MTAMTYGAEPANTGLTGRFHWYVGFIVVLSVVCDGWAGKPSPVLHQLLLLPAAGFYGYALWNVLQIQPVASVGRVDVGRTVPFWLVILVGLEAWAAFLLLAEARHYRTFGYHLSAAPCGAALLLAAGCWGWFYARRGASELFTACLGTSFAGWLVSICCFPLNYLRSDMLPVIGWADARLLRHENPYGTMYVGGRVYDFPYLPGMLVGYLPPALLHVDLRWASWFYVSAVAALVFWATVRERRFEAALLLAVFLLCPFLQYRHDIYLEPHWFTLAIAVVLMQRRRFFLSALFWGASCAVYQLSWVVVPFVFLNAYRRKGFTELGRTLLAVSLGALLVSGPFLASAFGRIANNTVGQWDRLTHALADPINLSYWLTYVIRPSQLKWVQAAILTALFVYCFIRHRCTTLVDTLRWMCCALAIFIPLNVLVDGYFYLTLALMLLFFVCAAEGYWSSDEAEAPVAASS